LEVPTSAAAGDAVDEDDDYSLIVSRSGDILASTQSQVSGVLHLRVNVFVSIYLTISRL